ncbi:MAG: hypothetical protein LRZ85_08835 [Alphaproteobacteria bacterium]|nr:hypothetical protein [Alphaproteobacteria bacterium]MCD8570175.1 hypothetical protein [Alphaproteobacteria bacterium]
MTLALDKLVATTEELYKGPPPDNEIQPLNLASTAWKEVVGELYQPPAPRQENIASLALNGDAPTNG